MNNVDTQYLNLLHILLDAPVRKDRTGVGAHSVFGHQMRFDLSNGFPLLTTKKMFIRGMVDELLWFVSGSTNVFDLPKGSQHWWTPWANEDGELGAIYGEQYLRSRWFTFVKPLVFEPIPAPNNMEATVFGVGTLGNARLLTGAKTENSGCRTEMDDILLDIWRDMLRRCYHRSSIGYPAYGAKGIHVDPSWWHFPTFCEDAKKLSGWNLKQTFPSNYSLDKDILHASNRYSKETCIWAGRAEQSYNTTQNTPFFATNTDGKDVFFASLGEANRGFNLNLSAIHRCLKGKLKSHHGWTNFRYLEEPSKQVIRFREINQLENVIASIKCDPNSRRHLINLWHTPAMQHTKLPCCHGSIIQFYVQDGKLSCMIYQRSADSFLGLPVNIASYALLTHLIARECNLKVGELIWTGGDVHLYLNHIKQAKLQLKREPYALPQIKLNPEIDNIFKFTMDDVELIDYQHHDTIKAEVAV